MALTPGIYGDYNFALGNSNIVVGNKNIFSGEKNIAKYSDENIVSGENNLVKNSFNNILNAKNLKLENSNKNVVNGDFINYSDYSTISFTSNNSLVLLKSEGSYLENINFEKSLVNLYFNNFGDKPFDGMSFTNSIVNKEITQYVEFVESDVLDVKLLLDSNFPFTFLVSLVKELYGTQNYENFGSSVAADNNYIYVGSSSWKNSDGNQVGKLTIFNKSDYSNIKELYGTQTYESFGYSVTIDDNYIYVGSINWENDNGEYVGKLIIFNKSDYSSIKELYGIQDNESFGSSITTNDNYIYVGSSSWKNSDGNKVGKLTIFNKSNYSNIKELYGTQTYESFGSSMSVDNNYIYVGSPGFNSEGENTNGKLTLFKILDYTIVKELYGTQTYESFGSSVAVDDRYIYTGSSWFSSDGLSSNGKLTIFNKSDYSSIKELYGIQTYEEFGSSVAADDNYIYVGSPNWENRDGNQVGKLTIYNKS